MNYTVEVAVEPIHDGNWDRLHEILDNLPGSLLLEDPLDPTFIIPVDAATPHEAAKFIDGVAVVMNLTLIRGQVYPAPAVDFDQEPDTDLPAGHAHRWDVDGNSSGSTARLVTA